MTGRKPCKVAKGIANHPAYKRWANMVSRCHNPKTPCFHHYGGRGIFVCEEWRRSSAAFIEWAMRNGFSPGLQIDRIDNDGPYSPENCRFVTQAENLENRRALALRKRARVLADGTPLIDAIAVRGLNRATVMSRIYRRGLTTDQALAFEQSQLKCSDGRQAVVVAAENGISANTFWVRVTRGWPVDLAATRPIKAKKPAKKT